MSEFPTETHTPRPLTVGSLFSGIGGLELGLERAGFKVIWQCERDPYARKVLAKHWPNIPCYDDVRTLNASTVERPDVLCGGFPCQDISSAGKGAGLAGERSGLWWEFFRLIRDLGPKYALLENVAALTYRGLGDILGYLSEIGYDTEWSELSACALGAPHVRRRLFIMAYPARVDGQNRLGERRGYQTTDEQAQRSEYTQCWKDAPSGSPRSAHGVPNRMDRNRCVGNAVAPPVAEFVARRLLQIHRERVISS